MGDICKSARATVHTFKHICTLPLLHRPKGILLVTVNVSLPPIMVSMRDLASGSFETCSPWLQTRLQLLWRPSQRHVWRRPAHHLYSTSWCHNQTTVLSSLTTSGLRRVGESGHISDGRMVQTSRFSRKRSEVSAPSTVC